ncbi:MAG: argininosuccinate lyase [Bacteroidota bacterium]|jgi:argininosuccinate lyase|nr:argininosuccinate lyase [Prolixibacteraceae bacterium]MDI9564422.1 argininosuccinate lyase [Bacteroidota bacterium]NLT00726.1 argininosuccinate lyase [Bacteroidales bacterium]HOC86878.1 argininosuccinate lyase [Prolixibacteraceae bacterium]HOG96276.1 argininosuccinate lyase [Prolixibacteraceae bacterium]
MKLWEKGFSVDAAIERFTVGKDRELDILLAPFDILGSMAHAIMLESAGLLGQEELSSLLHALRELYDFASGPDFVIGEGVEDIHSQVELMLTRRLGDTGKKIHTGRSRNDQVLLDLKLFTRERIRELTMKAESLADELLAKSEQYKDVLMPGYTHLQVAMPSSFGLWFGAYAESLVDDLLFLQAAFRIVNQNPLGSAAGYGSSLPLDRKMTTRLLGFEQMNYNVVYAQMGRGKMERTVAYALANLAATLSKFAFDVCLYMSQNFNFVSLPEELTTGSSIMPHKKNPDVFELVRGHCNKIQGLPCEVTLISNNLPSGYFRDMQVMKEVFLPAFEELSSCLGITLYAIQNIRVNRNILDEKKYDHLFTVEEVNKLVMKGMPFRDAYREVGRRVMEGEFVPDRSVEHTHEGSIGNLCLNEIRLKKEEVVKSFHFKGYQSAVEKLLNTSLRG